jgi:tetratricopeptide (TPR) repeat protein
MSINAQSDKTKSDIDFLLMREDYQKAASAIELVLKKDSSNTELLYKLGLSYQKTFRYNKAIDAYSKYSRLKKNNDVNLSMGNCQMELGNTDEAKVLFCQAFENDSTNMMAGLNLAGILVDKQKFQEAVNVYSKLSSIDTANSYIYRQLGFCFTKLDSINLADSCFEKSLKLNPEDVICLQQLINNYIKLRLNNQAIKLLTEYLANKPGNPLIHKLLGEVYFSLKNYVAANISYSKAITYGDSSAYTFQKLGIGYYSNGISLDTTGAMYKRLRKESFNLAKTALEKAMEKESNAITCYFLGLVNQITEDYDQSIKYFLKSIKLIIPDVLPNIYIKLGSSYLAQKEYEKLIEAYQHAFIFQSENYELLLKIGEIYDHFLLNKSSAINYYNDYLSKSTVQDEERNSIKKRIKQLKVGNSNPKVN